jgi:peptidoglycan-N-acetylglucosamine deacetylase
MRRAVAGTGAAALAAWAFPALAPRVPGAARVLRVPCRLPEGGAPEGGERQGGERQGGPRAVALTFDDGPHPEGTPAVLDALAAAGARATFFVLGEQVERHPGLVERIVAGGHAVALHGHTHRMPLTLTPRAFADDLARGAALVADAAGRPPRWYRPPRGKFSWPALATVRARGLEPLLWSSDPRDFSPRSDIVGNATRGLGPGAVLLLHDSDAYATPGSHRRTAAALPRLLEEIERRGLETVAL